MTKRKKTTTMSKTTLFLWLVILSCHLDKVDGKRDEVCGNPPRCICYKKIYWVECSLQNLDKVPEFEQIIMLSTSRLFLKHNMFAKIPDFTRQQWPSLHTVDMRNNGYCLSTTTPVITLADGIDVMVDVCHLTTTMVDNTTHQDNTTTSSSTVDETTVTTTTTTTTTKTKTPKIPKTTVAPSTTTRRKRLPTPPTHSTTVDVNMITTVGEEETTFAPTHIPPYPTHIPQRIIIFWTVGILVALVLIAFLVIVFVLCKTKKMDSYSVQRGVDDRRVENIGMGNVGNVNDGADGQEGAGVSMMEARGSMEDISLRNNSSEEEMTMFSLQQQGTTTPRLRTPSKDTSL